MNKSSRSSFATSFSLPMQSTTESDRPITAPIAVEENTRPIISARNKCSAPARTFNPPVIDLLNSIDQSRDSSAVPCKSKPLESTTTRQIVQRSSTDSNIRESFTESFVARPPPPPMEIKEEIPTEVKSTRRNSQSKVKNRRRVISSVCTSHSRPMVFNILPISVVGNGIRKIDRIINLRKSIMMKALILSINGFMNIKVLFPRNTIKQYLFKLNFPWPMTQLNGI